MFNVASQPLTALQRTAGWRRPMIMLVALTLFCSVGVWASVAVSEFEVFITFTTAGAALVAGAMAWWRWITLSSLVLTLTAALVPLWGFASEVQTTTPIVELLWLALAFFIGGIIIPGAIAFVALAGLWGAAVFLLGSNEAISEVQTAEASVMLGFVCSATMVISYLGNRLERHINANHRKLSEIQAKMLSQNQDLDMALMREQKVSRQKEQFLASFSHELRTPLNAVLGLCEALQEDVYGPLTEMQRRSLQTIESSGRHLLNLIVDILDVARIGAGRLMTSVQPCSLSQVAAVAEREIQAEVKAKNLSVEFSLEDDNLTVHSDPAQIQRIVRNLFSNAIKFTPEGGKIGLRVCSSRCGKVALLTVWDHGIGMTSEEVNEIYQPFVQSDGGLSRQYNGLGLGLTLSTRLAHLIGASLLVESEPEKGSEFTLALPLSGPRQVTLYGDLNCPFSYALNEWFEQAGVSHLIHWKGVEHMPELDNELANAEHEQGVLDEELERLSDRAAATQIALCRPEFRPNTRTGLLALQRIAALYPERLDELRGKLFRALWRDGKDISDAEIITSLLGDYDIGSFDANSSELETLTETTSEWRALKEQRLPMAVSKRTGKTYAGLGKRTNLTEFLREELHLSDGTEERPNSRDLTRHLKEQHIAR